MVVLKELAGSERMVRVKKVREKICRQLGEEGGWHPTKLS